MVSGDRQEGEAGLQRAVALGALEELGQVEEHPEHRADHQQAGGVGTDPLASDDKNNVGRILPTDSIVTSCLIGNIRLRTAIRLVARTTAGVHIREAAAPMKMLLRVIR